MKSMWKSVLAIFVFFSFSAAENMEKGEKLFKAYCWGCHHQTAEAFGPSFRSIANKRDKGTIISQIVDPAETAKRLGYKRSSMPPFDDLNATQLELLADFVLSFKEKS
jgi:cytochrome c551/c552